MKKHNRIRLNNRIRVHEEGTNITKADKSIRLNRDLIHRMTSSKQPKNCIYRVIPSSFKIYTRSGKLEPATCNNLDRFGFGYWRTDTANQRGGEWMGADKNSSQWRWKLQQDERGFQHTSPTHYPSWPSPRSHWSATEPRNQHTQPSDSSTQRNTKPRVYRPTPVRPVSTTGQTSPC
jgi:hypothetical protein